MKDKLNTSALEEYSQSYAKRLSNYFFIDNETVTGKQILTFCEIQQVNLFVLGGLFDSWQQEVKRLRSPYFNYQAVEVEEALKAFMDTVSRHIAVGKENFEPLLTRAVQDTLLLSIAPRQYFDLWQEQMGKEFTIERLKGKLKYFQINKFILKGLVDRMEAEGKASVVSIVGMRWIEEIIEAQSSQLDKPEIYLEVFSQKLPVGIEDFLNTPVASQTEPIVFSVPVYEPIIEAMEEVEESQTESTQEPIAVNMMALPKEPTIELSLNERLGRDQQTLNDSLKQVVAKDTIMDRHLKTRIENIKSAIPLNQKFVFINELFRGDTSAYHQALNELEQCENYKSATELLMQKYARNYGWNMEGEEVEAFFEIIERKFY
ncbi:MAG: hypothetical protein V4714_17070 [Bacteroidota bacterium]